jgi:hypothetical protein
MGKRQGGAIVYSRDYSKKKIIQITGVKIAE